MANIIFASSPIDDAIGNAFKDIDVPTADGKTLLSTPDFKSKSLLDTTGDLLRTNGKGMIGTTLGGGALYTATKINSGLNQANYRMIRQAAMDEAAQVARLEKLGIRATTTLPQSATESWELAKRATRKSYLTPFGFGPEADAMREGRIFASPQASNTAEGTRAILSKDAEALAKVASTSAETAAEGQMATGKALKELAKNAVLKENYLRRGVNGAENIVVKVGGKAVDLAKWAANTPIGKGVQKAGPWLELANSSANAFGTPWEAPDAHFYNPLSYNYNPTEWNGRAQKEWRALGKGAGDVNPFIRYPIQTAGATAGAAMEYGKGAGDLLSLYIPSMLGIAPWHEGESGGSNLSKVAPPVGSSYIMKDKNGNYVPYYGGGY